MALRNNFRVTKKVPYHQVWLYSSTVPSAVDNSNIIQLFRIQYLLQITAINIIFHYIYLQCGCHNSIDSKLSSILLEYNRFFLVLKENPKQEDLLLFNLTIIAWGRVQKSLIRLQVEPHPCPPYYITQFYRDECMKFWSKNPQFTNIFYETIWSYPLSIWTGFFQFSSLKYQVWWWKCLFGK